MERGDQLIAVNGVSIQGAMYQYVLENFKKVQGDIKLIDFGVTIPSTIVIFQFLSLYIQYKYLYCCNSYFIGDLIWSPALDPNGLQPAQPLLHECVNALLECL